jgi:drug/metabolite transporter (DMT)-like permease
MARDGQFGGNPADAAAAAPVHVAPMIRTVMNRSDWLILLSLALIWGGAFFFISVAVRDVPPLTYVWLRLTFAAVALWLWAWWRGDLVALPRSIWGSMLLLALLNNAIPFILFGWGQTHIAAGLASILNATTPIWGVLVAHLFTRDEQLSGRKLAGILLGFGGVAVMIGPSFLSSLGGNLLPQLACLVAALCYALAGVWARRFRVQGVPPMTVSIGQLTAGAAAMLPLAMLVDRPWNMAPPPLTAWGAILALALLCSAFAYVLYFRLIDRAGATNALLVTLLTPPVAIILGALFLGELLDPRDFAGLALIALGLAAIDGRLLSLFRSSRPQAA